MGALTLESMAIIRADKLQTVKAVAEEILRDPTQTERQIGKKIGKDHSTVNRAKAELQAIAPKDLSLSSLVAKDIAIQKLAQDEMERRLTETPGKVAGTDLK